MGKIFDPEKYTSLLSAESYLREINHFPLLTPGEEFKFHKMGEDCEAVCLKCMDRPKR